MARRGALQVRWEDESKGQVRVADRSEWRRLLLLRRVGTPKRLAAFDEDVGLGYTSEPVQAGLVAANRNCNLAREQGGPIVTETRADGAMGGDVSETEYALKRPSLGCRLVSVERSEGEVDHGGEERGEGERTGRRGEGRGRARST